MISLEKVLDTVFGSDYELSENAGVVFGRGKISQYSFHLLGVKESTSFGAEQALIMAEHVLAIIDSQSTDPVFLLVDVIGQQLSMRDEWLGMHQYFSHLLLCLECLRTQGNHLVSLVYNQAIGGAFIAYGLTADTVLALPEAKVAVMWLDAMAKVTKLDLALLKQLAQSSPVFAPGVQNFFKLGGVTAVIELTQIAEYLVQSTRKDVQPDLRAQLASERGGRNLAYQVIQQVLAQTR